MISACVYGFPGIVMKHPNVTGATPPASTGVLTAGLAAAYTFHITIIVFRRAETVCMRKRRNRWTRRIRTASWNSRRRARSCICLSVQRIRTSTFRPTVTAKRADSPAGCARSLSSAGSAPETLHHRGADSAQQSQGSGRYLGRCRPLFRARCRAGLRSPEACQSAGRFLAKWARSHDFACAGVHLLGIGLVTFWGTMAWVTYAGVAAEVVSQPGAAALYTGVVLAGSMAPDALSERVAPQQVEWCRRSSSGNAGQ